MIVAAVLFSFLAAVVPSAFYVGVAWWLDRYEKEPWWVLTLTFFWGAVPAIVLALIVEVVFDIPLRAFFLPSRATFFSSAVVAPVVEEIVKAVPLVMVYWLYRREFDGLMDGLLYGAIVGLGFSMTENLFYFLGALAEGGVGSLVVVAFLRAVVFGLNHALFSSALGLGLGVARYAHSAFVRWLAPPLGLLAGIGLHIVHNTFVATGSVLCLVSLLSDWAGIVLWLALVWFAGQQEARWIREELAAEVAEGLLTPQEALAAGRYRDRVAVRWAALREEGVGYARKLGQLYALAAELAFRKRQFRLNRDDPETAREIVDLRRRIRRLREELAAM